MISSGFWGLTALRCLPSLAPYYPVALGKSTLIFLHFIGKIRTVLSTVQEHREHEQNNVDKACNRAEAHSGPLKNTSFLVGSVGESQSSDVKEGP